MAADPLSAAFARPPKRLDLAGSRPAAVAVVIGPDDGLLLIRRADKAGDPWSGHVGFPGGHVEPGESFDDAARREAWEEVGIDLTGALMLGGLDDCGTPALVPSRVVRPFVFRVADWPPFQLQAAEVASAHVTPLDVLRRGVGRTRFDLDHSGRTWTLPCVDLPVGRLWGMTLRMVDDLLDRLDGRGHGLARPPGR